MISINCINSYYDKRTIRFDIEAGCRDLEQMFPDGDIDPRKLLNVAFGKKPKVERVIVNPPATILFWDDGEKTVVKCHECGDGKCIFDKDFEMPTLDANTVTLDDLSQLDETVAKIARCGFCQTHYDEEKAVMAAMLKRLYPNFQNVLRDALEGDDE